jgi:hypothetical protein
VKAPCALCLTLILLSRALCLAIGAGRLPGETITNEKGTSLQYSVCSDVFAIERRLVPACKKPRVSHTIVLGQPRRFGPMMRWDERWTVDRCGGEAIYVIHFHFRGSVGTYKIEAPKS